MFVCGKGNFLEPSFFTFSTHAIILWVGQVKYGYQNMTTLEYKLLKTTTDNIVLQFKVLTEPKPVPFRRYVLILRGNTDYMTGTDQWCTRVCQTIQKRNTYSRSLRILYLRLDNPRLVIRHRRCFEFSKKNSMKFSNNKGKASETSMAGF